MAVEILNQNYIADGPIGAYKIVKLGSDAAHVTQSTGPTDGHWGVTGSVGALAAGDRPDVLLIGMQRVTAGAAFGYGVPLTSDANGNAVAAAPAAGVNNRIIGFSATSASAAGDVAEVLISQGQIQG